VWFERGEGCASFRECGCASRDAGSMVGEAVLVTGGSGFVGRHLVHQLSQRGYKVRVLVRRVPPLGFDQPVEVVVGDLAKPESYASTLTGTTTIVHAALTGDFSGDLKLTAALGNLSAKAGVRKFIHLSSIAVYGNPPDGTITEATPPLPTSDAYARMKLGIEEGLRATSQIPEVMILRLGCVYGPGPGWWTHGLLRLMERGKLIVVNGGTGTANLIHVADVATIVLLLLERFNPPFDIWNVTDGMPVPWSRYFSELEKILGRSATISMTVSEAQQYGKKWLRPNVMRRAIRKLVGGALVHPIDDRGIEGYASRAVYSNEKAAKTLAFRPNYDLETGMRTVAL
jgi:nucleoside-diphosphate-sugar epimerase